MSKSSVTLLFALWMAVSAVCDGFPLFGVSSESNESFATLDFFIKMSEQCKNNTGSDGAFSVLLNSFAKTSTCLSKFDDKEFLDQITNTSRTELFNKYCSEVGTVTRCLDDLLVSLRPCLKEGMFKIANAILSSIPEALDLACKNDGEIIFKLSDERRKKCFVQKVDQLTICSNTFTSKWKNVWDAPGLTLDHCSILTGHRQCVKDQLDDCDLSDIITIYDVPKNAMLRLTPCVNESNVQWRDPEQNAEMSKYEPQQNNSNDEI